MLNPKQNAAILAGFLVASLSSTLGAIPRAIASDQNPVVSTSDLVLRILYTPTYLAAVTTAASLLSSQGDAQKKALASAALEDAAQFYASGRLGGILPSVIAQVREADPALASLEDAVIVELIVAATEESLAVGPQGLTR